MMSSFKYLFCQANKYPQSIQQKQQEQKKPFKDRQLHHKPERQREEEEG